MNFIQSDLTHCGERLQVKFTSAEAQFRDLLGRTALQDELEAAYNQLRQAQQTVVQQERLRALGQMASGMAHDINNSLTPIIGYTDYLLDDTSGVSDEVKKYLRCVRTAAGEIAHLVEQVRHFYRRRDDHEVLPALDLNQMAREVIEVARPRWYYGAQQNGAVTTIEMSTQEDLPRVRENESELRQAINHLVSNALDAMPNGGTLTITTRSQDRSMTGGSGVLLEVRDTGLGMDELTRQRCFEPFFSTKGPGGSGLGLAWVYGVMRRHQGSVEVESQPGHGTAVRLVFHAADRPSAADGGCTSDKLPPLRILCIDDDQRIGAMLQQVLTSQRHIVEVANGGEKGVEAFRLARRKGQPFQVVITDLGMPHIDGRQIVRTVKLESPETPVIMLTGWTATIDQNDELPRGVDAVVTKPATIDRLQEALAQVTRACAA